MVGFEKFGSPSKRQLDVLWHPEDDFPGLLSRPGQTAIAQYLICCSSKHLSVLRRKGNMYMYMSTVRRLSIAKTFEAGSIGSSNYLTSPHFPLHITALQHKDLVCAPTDMIGTEELGAMRKMSKQLWGLESASITCQPALHGDPKTQSQCQLKSALHVNTQFGNCPPITIGTPWIGIASASGLQYFIPTSCLFSFGAFSSSRFQADSYGNYPNWIPPR